MAKGIGVCECWGDHDSFFFIRGTAVVLGAALAVALLVPFVGFLWGSDYSLWSLYHVRPVKEYLDRVDDMINGYGAILVALGVIAEGRRVLTRYVTDNAAALDEVYEARGLALLIFGLTIEVINFLDSFVYWFMNFFLGLDRQTQRIDNYISSTLNVLILSYVCRSIYILCRSWRTN